MAFMSPVSEPAAAQGSPGGSGSERGARSNVPHLADQVRSALAVCRARIVAAGADPAGVRIVAVTKGFGIDEVRAVAAAGLVDVGENYARDLLSKKAALGEAPSADPGHGGGHAAGHDAEGLNWHFIGSVQRNKIAALSSHVALWQTIDRLEAGQSLCRHATGAKILVQVNITGLPGRPGCTFSELEALVAELGQLDLDVGGVMGVGPGGDPADARGGFRRLAEHAAHLGLREVSMGMSDDLEIAVAEGSTMLRLGRALLGPRPVR